MKNVAWKTINSYGVRGADADDAYAATMFRLAEHLDRIREPERLPGWVATTARNETLGLFRSRRRTVVVDEVPERDSGNGEPDAALVRDELREAVRRSFALLDDAVPAPAAHPHRRSADPLRRRRCPARDAARLHRPDAATLPRHAALQGAPAIVPADMSTDDELLAALRDVLDADEPLRDDVAEMIERRRVRRHGASTPPWPSCSTTPRWR